LVRQAYRREISAPTVIPSGVEESRIVGLR
jgi:hypothetical protein